MMTFFVFHLLVTIVLATARDIKLSGDLAPQTPISNQDKINYQFIDSSKAVLTLNQPIISVNGGVVSVDGDDNEIVIEQNYCVDGVSCSDPELYLMDLTGGSTIFSMNDCKFRGRDKYVSVIYAHNTQEITISKCEVSGTLFMFAKVSNTNQMTMSGCEFKNVGDESAFAYPFYGSILTLVNCNQLTLAKCTFKKVDAGTYDKGQVAVSGGVTGYAAPVFIRGSQQATLSNCKFEDCSGLLAGAIFSYEQGIQSTYNKLEFLDNTYTLPVNNLTVIVETIPGIGALVSALKNYTELGNDLTRLGGTSPSIHKLCSTSVKPHYRNDLTTESFGECGLLDVGAIVGIVLGAVAVVVIAVGIVLCCCCCPCCCCPCCCCPCPCSHQRCKRTIPSDYETPGDVSTNAVTSADPASQQVMPANPINYLPQQSGAPPGYQGLCPPTLLQAQARPGLLPQPFLLPEGYPLPQDTQQPQEKEKLVTYAEESSSSSGDATVPSPYPSPYRYLQPQTGRVAPQAAQAQAAPYDLPRDACLQPPQRGQTQLPQAQAHPPQYDVHDFYTQPAHQEGYGEGY